MPPHLAHHVAGFQASIGTKKYDELCKEAKKPSNLPRVVEWMVQADAARCGYGKRSNYYGWLEDQSYFESPRDNDIKKAMHHPVVEHFEWEADILVIVVSGVCFHVSEWYLGYALHCMGNTQGEQGESS